jgi:hypothetical protein
MINDPSFDLWANLQPALVALVFITLPLFGVIVLLEKVFSRSTHRSH